MKRWPWRLQASSSAQLQWFSRSFDDASCKKAQAREQREVKTKKNKYQEYEMIENSIFLSGAITCL